MTCAVNEGLASTWIV